MIRFKNAFLQGDLKMKIWDFYAPIYKNVVHGDRKYYGQMYEWVKEVINGKKVLEIATGPGLFAKNVAESAAEMIATDFSEGMILQAEKNADIPNLKFEVADATNLPYEDFSFDVVIVSNALHAIPDLDKAMSEIARVLKSDGILIAPQFIHLGPGIKRKFFSSILKMAGIKFYNEWTDSGFADFLVSKGWKIVKQESLPSRIPILYTQSIKEKQSEIL